MRKNKKIITLSCGLLSLVIMDCTGSAREGAALFERERCVYCHTFKGKGAKVGPDLTNVTKRRSDEWLRDQIKNPKLHYPNPGMPGHEYLSEKEISAIIKYLKS